MNLNLTSAFRTTKSVITANSPVLLVGAAVSAIVGTGLLAAKGGYKARGIIDAEQLERDSFETSTELTTVEKFQLTWLCYAPATLTAVGGIASVVGSHVIHTKRQAAMASLLAVASTKLDDARDQAEEMLGPKKAQLFNDATAQKQMDREPQFENNEVIITPHGSDLCYDDWSGRFFYGSYNKIEAAFNDVNRLLANEGHATLNDFYEAVGIPGTEMGETFGWDGIALEPRFASTLSEGRPTITFRFHREPKTPVGRG